MGIEKIQEELFIIGLGDIYLDPLRDLGLALGLGLDGELELQLG